MKCNDCGDWMPYEVMCSQAGWYVGRQCKCGPWDRYTSYFKTKEEAEKELEEIKRFKRSLQSQTV